MKKNKKPDWAIQIRKARIAHNYTQPQLAALLGVSLTLIQKIEAGTRTPSYYLLHNISDCLDVHLLELYDLCSRPEYYEKEWSEIDNIIAKANIENLGSPPDMEESKYSDCSCWLHRTTDDAECYVDKEELLLKSYELKQQLKHEYEKRLLKYVESLFK
ncbi:MAG: helix-turn-helix transcriptional regulator [Phascolarctobacterium sp.]|nr:helix-turn-helix transcriptional regulator [Phascolarctobacterium sp.]